MRYFLEKILRNKDVSENPDRIQLTLQFIKAVPSHPYPVPPHPYPVPPLPYPVPPHPYSVLPHPSSVPPHPYYSSNPPFPVPPHPCSVPPQNVYKKLAAVQSVSRITPYSYNGTQTKDPRLVSSVFSIWPADKDKKKRNSQAYKWNPRSSFFSSSWPWSRFLEWSYPRKNPRKDFSQFRSRRNP